MSRWISLLVIAALVVVGVSSGEPVVADEPAAVLIIVLDDADES